MNNCEHLVKSLYLKDVIKSDNSKKVLRLNEINFFCLHQYLPLPKLSSVKYIFSGFSLLDVQQHNNFTVVNQIRNHLEEVAPNLEEILINNKVRVWATSKEIGFNVAGWMKEQFKALVKATESESRVVIRLKCKVHMIVREEVSYYSKLIVHLRAILLLHFIF